MKNRCNSCFECYEGEYDVCPHCGYVKGTPPEEIYHLYPGTLLYNRYIVGAVLGFGGFGITYMAWDKTLEAIIAIKEFYPSGYVNRIPGTKNIILFTGKRGREYESMKERFLDEAKSMARFSSHQNIINVFEYFEENNTAYIVMEYLEGLTLSKYLHENDEKVDVDTGIEIALSVCAALKAVHAEGIIHRDVSPDNIFICTNGIIKLIDFGAARFASGEEKLMTIILKPGYAPPEQYERVNIQGPWTDIYALGATLYLAITGIKPQESTNRKTVDTLQSPAEVNPLIPEFISNTIMKAMALDKYLRFSTIDEFEKALNKEKKVIPIAKEKRKRKNRRLFGIVTAVLIIAIGVTTFSFAWENQKKAETLPTAEISLWYKICGDEEIDKSKKAALDEIISTFTASYPNVIINISGILDYEYDERFLEAVGSGNAPVLFESTDVDIDCLRYTIELTPLIDSLQLNDYHFLNDYNEYFPETKQFPLGFDLPVIYVNTSLTNVDGNSVSDLSSLPSNTNDDLCRFALNRKTSSAFYDVYGNSPEFITEDAKNKFLSGKALFYFSDTSDYFAVQEALPVMYKTLSVDSDNVLCSFNNMWSINMSSSDEEKIAFKLLTFMLSDNSQDLLHIRNVSGALPLNKKALDIYCDVYDEFGEFLINLDRCTFY